MKTRHVWIWQTDCTRAQLSYWLGMLWVDTDPERPVLFALQVSRSLSTRSGRRPWRWERWPNRKVRQQEDIRWFSFFYFPASLVCSVFSSLFTLSSTCFVFFFSLTPFLIIIKKKRSYTCKHTFAYEWTQNRKLAISSRFLCFYCCIIVTFSVQLNVCCNYEVIS